MQINLDNYFRQISSVFVRHHSSLCSFSKSDSWGILSSIEQRIKAKIEAVGTQLKDWDINIYRGILTGYNEAFIITGKKRKELIAEDPKCAEIIRPILRGRDIKRYVYDFADLWLINAHNGIKEKSISPINVDNYPAIKKHLENFYPQLTKRADKGDTPYNLRNCAYMEDFSKQKIVWGNLNLTATYCIAESGVFVNAPCPMIVPANKYLLAVLNSKLADYYIRNLGVTRNGGYFEYKPMFIEQLPVPINIEPDLSKIIINYCEAIQNHKANKLDYKEIDAELNRIIYNLYGLDSQEIELIESINSLSSTVSSNNL